jgi:hypothetical protein
VFEGKKERKKEEEKEKEKKEYNVQTPYQRRIKFIFDSNQIVCLITAHPLR